MNRSLFRAAACTLAAVAATLALLAVPASSPSQAASFTFSDNNCSSFTLQDTGGGNFTLTCQTTSGGTFSCPISTSNSAPTVSSLVTLTANCSNAVGSVGYTWTLRASSTVGCPTTTSTTNQASLAAPGGTAALTCVYDLSATDGTPTTVTPSKTVSYSVGGGGGGGGGGTTDTTACSNLGLNPKVISVPWASQTIYTTNNGGFGANDAVLVKFTTPATIPAGTGLGKIGAVEFQSSPSARTGSLSPNPCEFGLPGTLPGGGFAGTNAPLISFKLPGSTKTALSLQANTTYYFNIRNDPGSTCSSNGSCDMLITMSKPSGT